MTIAASSQGLPLLDPPKMESHKTFCDFVGWTLLGEKNMFSRLIPNMAQQVAQEKQTMEKEIGI